jgi:hypothetical protein
MELTAGLYLRRAAQRTREGFEETRGVCFGGRAIAALARGVNCEHRCTPFSDPKIKMRQFQFFF